MQTCWMFYQYRPLHGSSLFKTSMYEVLDVFLFQTSSYSWRLHSTISVTLVGHLLPLLQQHGLAHSTDCKRRSFMQEQQQQHRSDEGNFFTACNRTNTGAVH